MNGQRSTPAEFWRSRSLRQEEKWCPGDYIKWALVACVFALFWRTRSLDVVVHSVMILLPVAG